MNWIDELNEDLLKEFVLNHYRGFINEQISYKKERLEKQTEHVYWDEAELITEFIQKISDEIRELHDERDRIDKLRY